MLSKCSFLFEIHTGILQTIFANLFKKYVTEVHDLSLNEPHTSVANRAQAQCIMVRTYTELIFML